MPQATTNKFTVGSLSMVRSSNIQAIYKYDNHIHMIDE